MRCSVTNIFGSIESRQWVIAQIYLAFFLKKKHMNVDFKSKKNKVKKRV
jgi:hypothetical protein